MPKEKRVVLKKEKKLSGRGPRGILLQSRLLQAQTRKILNWTARKDRYTQKLERNCTETDRITVVLPALSHVL